MEQFSIPWEHRTKVSYLDVCSWSVADVFTLGPGLKNIFEAIDNRTDFKSYMQNYAVARGTPRGPRRDGPYDEGFVSVLLAICF